MVKRVGGMDPGSTTGICLLEYEPDEVLRWGSTGLSTWQIMKKCLKLVEFEQLGDASPEICALDCYRWFVQREPDVVVMEDFVLYAGLGLHGYTPSADRTGLDPVRVQSAFITVGILEKMPFPVHYQMASEAKGQVTNERLRQAGLWRKGMGTDRGKHAADAIRHAAHWIRSEEF